MKAVLEVPRPAPEGGRAAEREFARATGRERGRCDGSRVLIQGGEV